MCICRRKITNADDHIVTKKPYAKKKEPKNNNNNKNNHNNSKRRDGSHQPSRPPQQPAVDPMDAQAQIVLVEDRVGTPTQKTIKSVKRVEQKVYKEEDTLTNIPDEMPDIEINRDQPEPFYTDEQLL